MEKQNLRLEWWDAAELQDNPLNWKDHPKIQERGLRDLIDDVSWAGALLLNERTGRLVDGHARKKIARPGEKVPVLIGWWTEEQERKILLTFDAIGGLATADKSALEKLMASVAFESPALNTILEGVAHEAGLKLPGQDDELKEPADHVEQAEELREKWNTAFGQLWAADQLLLACGDGTDPATLARLWINEEPVLQTIWTDPPWAVNYGGKTAWMEKRGAQRKREDIKNDSLKPEQIRKLFGTALKLASAYAKPGASLYAAVPSGTLLPHFIASLDDGGFTFKHSLVWIKNSMVLGRSDYNYRHETILYGWLENGPHYFTSDRTHDSVFEIDRPVASPFHPTTKPIQLVARMITNSSRKGDLVYDPFCGSGTTMLAGAQLGRRVFAVELDPRYVAVSLERLSALGMKPKLLTDR